MARRPRPETTITAETEGSDEAALRARLTAAEDRLALVNEIGLALASDLDFHAIIELVGERLRTTMRPDSMFIATVDAARGWIDFPYGFEAGSRFQMEGFRLGAGLTSRVIRDRRPLRFGTNDESIAEGAILSGVANESWLGVPIIAGDDVIGVIVFEDPARDAFDESDERLLGTLAASMGVALRNAALFDETRRLLTETDERAAELAIINGVQQGLAAELDLQAMYDLVGDKIQEIFDAQVVDIGIFDHERGMISYPYTIERGVRFPDEPVPISRLARELIDTGKPIRVDDVSTLAPGFAVVTQGEAAKSLLMAPLIAGGDVRGRISLQNLDKTHAFSEADSRLLSTIASSLGVALENVRLFDETQAPPDRDRRAGRRTGHHQRGAAGPGRGARPASDVRPRRRQDPGDLRRPGRGHRHPGPRGRRLPLPVHDRAGRPAARRGGADGGIDPGGSCATLASPS